jgi:hypothetical protein
MVSGPSKASEAIERLRGPVATSFGERIPEANYRIAGTFKQKSGRVHIQWQESLWMPSPR